MDDNEKIESLLNEIDLLEKQIKSILNLFDDYVDFITDRNKIINLKEALSHALNYIYVGYEDKQEFYQHWGTEWKLAGREIE